ncbi:MAG: tetratricopeptide repeat protein [Gemmatimonadales bacterium]
MCIARLLALTLLATPLAAQMTADQHVAAGDSLRSALQSADALRQYQQALSLAPHRYDANWKAAREIADVAKQLLGDSLKQPRDSLYSLGRIWAESAIRADSGGADGHFALALVLGRLSRTRGGKERVRFAKIIYDETARAIQLDPRHDGAFHILGMWHAEVKRLSGLTRFFAKTLFGAGFMDRASWDSARIHMERSVALNPQYVYHRLELAGVYLDVREVAKATEQLQAIDGLPVGDPMDPYYKRIATAALADLRGNRIGDARERLRKG